MLHVCRCPSPASGDELNVNKDGNRCGPRYTLSFWMIGVQLYSPAAQISLVLMAATCAILLPVRNKLGVRNRQSPLSNEAIMLWNACLYLPPIIYGLPLCVVF